MRLKKLLAFVIALAMVMGITPTVSIAFADDSQVAVARVGETEYSSLALAVAEAGEAYVDEPVEVTLLADSNEDFTLDFGIVELVTGSYDYTGTVAVNNALLIADCELEEVVCTAKAANSDETKFGYTSMTIGVEMVDGAQVRIGEGADAKGKVVGEESGLRFIATVNRIDTLAGIAYEFYNSEASNYAADYQIGVKIMAEGSSEEVAIPATRWQSEGEVFTIALTNLAESNYNRRFNAAAYVEIEGIRFENDAYVTRSIYQVAAGLLADGEAEANEMSQALVNVLNAYVNQTGVRLTLTDSTADASLKARMGSENGAYTGQAFFTVGDTVYRNGMYQVTLKSVGKSVINTELFNEYVRINNNNTKVSPVTGIRDNGDGTYTVTFDYADMPNGSGVINEPVTLTNGDIIAYVPAGVAFSGSADKLKLVLKSIDDENSEVEAGDGEELDSFDIHVNGVTEDNTTPIIITLTEVAEKGLNRGNLKLYHVEDGVQVEMEQVDSAEELTKHNQFTYEPLDGTIVVALASFSEIALVADTENAWNGKYDYSWYDADATELTIANADQLAAFSAIVGGMDGKTQDSFADKTVKLVNNINLGDKESENNPDLIFYPIGYYNNAGNYEKVSGGSVTSGVESFKGTFDGNGHTISNFYQNTWEMFGDYNSGYSGTPNHYQDAMGLFGYVVNGIVKNLTVDNFSSDGEFTPTGVIAAYAVNSTFENIAITNCNPRVYNTGNGGIVGIGGNSDDPDTYNLKFTNITIDNSNKITALWGSWDVACGGLVGMFRGNGLVDFTNCHVAAQIDVYNDVCANYQYYWYRYSGMMIGSIRKNVEIDGSLYPDMTGITASDCTVHFGEWNDYWYCEFVANSIASYTHDYQFSRVEQSDLTWTDANNNGKIDDEEIESVTCKHDHTAAGYEETDINGDGVVDSNVLKEDKTAVYLPFDQLFTGYGWGVNSKGLKDVAENEDLDITILGRDVADSVTKFEKAETAQDTYTTSTTVNVGDLFKAAEIADSKLTIKPENVQVTVSPVGEDSTVSGTYAADKDDWTQGTLTFSGTGAATITITDYYFCKPTIITVEVEERKAVEKFDNKFTGDFLYRVGNQNAVALGSLFKAVEGAEIGGVSITVEEQNGTTASGTYTANTDDWTKGTIQFSGTGVVKVTITDNEYCTPTELLLEVVDAANATSATNATSKNIVLLNDCGFSSIEVSNGYTLYGNGFTMTCSSDSAVSDMGYAFVTLNNGTLDNVQIVCPNFDYAALYKSNLTSGENRSETDSNGKTRYYNAKSGVMASGNSQILNSRISGGRASLNVSGGNIVVDNSRIELGAVATILVGSANSLVLNDVTLIQKPAASTHDSNKTLMGFSVLYLCDSEGNATPTTIEGSFVQQAWIDEGDKKYVPAAGESIVTAVLEETDYLHDIDGDGKNESLNLGFAYMPEDITKTVAEPTNITDNRTDKATVPYEMKDVKVTLAIVSTTVYVYSYKNANGTADTFKTELKYVPNKYSDIITVTYSDTAEGLEQSKSYGTDGWVYELNVDLDKASGYAIDFGKLSMTVDGVSVNDYKVNGSEKPASTVAVTAGGITYELTATIDGKEYSATFKVTGTETSKESPSLVGTPSYGAGFGVANKYGGDWSAAAPVLDGITIKYWSVADSEYKEFALSSITFANTGKQNGTNNYWEYTHTNNDFTLKLTNTAVMHSNSGTYGMPVAGKDGKLYFTISSSGGFVSTGTTSRSIAIAYEFTDNNGGDTLKFSHTWSISYSKDEQYNYSSFTSDGTLTKLESSSSGCVTPETLITLADGSQVEVQHLKGDEELLVWNMETGKYDVAPIVFIDVDDATEYEIIHLYFEDETDVEVIYEHGFFDVTCGEYVYLDKNTAEEHIGHSFIVQDDIALNTWKTVKLTDVVIENRVTKAYSPVTFEHLCYYTDGMLSMPGGIEGLFNIFEVDTSIMAYDAEKMAQDIETYGLYTYEDFEDIIPEIAYEAYNGDILKVAIGKGMLTWERIYELAERYVK